MEKEFYEKERNRLLYFARGLRLLHGNSQHFERQIMGFRRHRY